MNTLTKSTNRIDDVFQRKQGKILSVYFTAGYPKFDATLAIMHNLQDAGADIIEIGIPYSDPVADGPTIQESNLIALRNGMGLRKLLEQLKDMRKTIKIPVILMGYLNPVMQYGIEKFCQDCEAIGIDGVILPDLPMQQYLDEFKPIFDAHTLYNIFLISPQTSDERIRLIDQNSKGFIYMVSSASITGAKSGITDDQIRYFKRIGAMGLQNPKLIGFGISNHETFLTASEYADGAIIGSAFIKVLKDSNDYLNDINKYIKSIKGIY